MEFFIRIWCGRLKTRLCGFLKNVMGMLKLVRLLKHVVYLLIIIASVRQGNIEDNRRYRRILNYIASPYTFICSAHIGYWAKPGNRSGYYMDERTPPMKTLKDYLNPSECFYGKHVRPIITNDVRSVSKRSNEIRNLGSIFWESHYKYENELQQERRKIMESPGGPGVAFIQELSKTLQPLFVQLLFHDFGITPVS